MKYPSIQIPLVLATVALAPLLAHAGTPVVVDCETPASPAPTHWPLWERPVGTDAEDFVIGTAAKRTGVWNSFGEFQTGSPRYVHTGIDINGQVTNEAGDFVVAAQSGHIFGTHTYNNFMCKSEDRCKLYIRTGDYRFMYYYAHLDLRPEGENDMSPDVSNDIREKIQIAVGFPDVDQTEEVYATTEVAGGEIISGLGTFINNYTHLHFALNDHCENFDGLNPLDWLDGTAHPGYEDQLPPVIEGLSLVDSSDATLVSHATVGKCEEVSDDFDVVAKLHDVWKEVPAPATLINGDDFLGTYETNYHIYNLTTQTSVKANTWYRFDTAPFRCKGEVRGKDCPDMAAEVPLFGSGGYVKEVNLFGDDEGPIGPILAHTFADIIYRAVSPFMSFSQEYYAGPPDVPSYFLTMNHEWGLIANNMAGGRIKLSDLDFGQHQVSVETFDQAGNGAVRSIFFTNTSGTSESMADLVIRDNPADTGAIPSTLGGNKHWRSPDIKVFLASDNVTLMPGDAIWDTPQAISINSSEDYKVYVRVENTGCTAIDEYEVKVGTAKGAMISAGWETIDMQKTVTEELDPGEATVVVFDWDPTGMQVGHQCMIAAVNTAVDPLLDIPVNLGEIDFEDPDVDQPTSVFVPADNNVAQRNITITGTSFQFGNPFGSSISLGVDLDCNDLPIELAGAQVKLRIEAIGSIGTDWAAVPNTSMTFNMTNGQYEFTLDRCKIQFPPTTVAANTEVEAWVDVTLPGLVTGTWRVDLAAKVNGVVRDGISVVHSQ